ncbi:MAG TPA: FeoC-like transcriptional regulator [Anaerolineae bacterium]|nr:FeoC-like transcriptional regulator [Anaerolineae bacterium]
MLKQILFEFQQSDRPLCLDELSYSLAIEPGVLAGMLQTLVQKGRLQEIGLHHNACVACPARTGCVIITNTAKTYVLAAPPYEF